MAQVQGVVSENFPESKVLKKTAENEDCPPSKKFKQGRLPFKPLDSCQTLQGTSPTAGSKKRKLSDNESPSAKQLKSSLGKPVPKSPGIECDPEVSSSSEADTSVQPGHQKGAKKINTLDRFFKPKAEAPDHAEISSTNQCDAIDLTEDNSVGTIEEVKVVEVPEKTTKALEDVKKPKNATQDVKELKKSAKEGVKDDEKTESKAVEKKIDETDEKGKDAVSDEVHKKTELEDSVMEEDEAADKENVTDKDVAGSLDESFVSDTSVCESALKTPAKGVKSESMLKTPVAATSKVSDKPPSSSSKKGQVSSSGNEATPKSAKRNSISGSKKKEQELQRQKLREEREREKEEKRLAKEKEKEEKEKERLEKKKQKEEERLEKEKQKQEEKDKREKERQEKLKQKEEEKKLKQKELDAKLEEKKKKEEEKKQKDEEKKQKEEEKKQKEEEKKREEEEKLKKEENKKTMFKRFFVQKAPTSSPPKVKEMAGNSFFMPFELKPNMQLAPHTRESLSLASKEQLDKLSTDQDAEELYLKKVKSAAYRPGRSSKTVKRTLKDTDDVEVLSHDKETIEKVTHKVKFLRFHENVRPPYYGTWRKPSDRLSARNPFKQDELLFDYEVDSDDEWEEEEPGESVSSDEEEDDKEKGEDDEEEGDGWMVPHGYLSDDEGIKDEEEVDMASKQDLQKVRQAAWESELKRQAKPLAMVNIGCVWQDSDTTAIAAQQLHTLLKYKAVCLKEGPIGTSFSRGRINDTDAAGKSEEKTAKTHGSKKSVPEEAIPELIRLVHGNPCGIKKLIKEFRMYWKLKTSPEKEKPETSPDNDKLQTSPGSGKPDSTTASPPNKDGEQAGTSAMDVDDKSEIKLEADTEKKVNEKDDFAISIRQLDIKIPAIAVRERRPDHKKMCWYVKDEVLKQYNMEEIKLPNSWEYVCIKAPKWAEEKVTPKAEDVAAAAAAVPAVSGRNTPNIMQFAQPMSPAMILAKEQKEQREKAELKEKLEKEKLEKSKIPVAADPTPAPAVPAEKDLVQLVAPILPIPTDQRTIKDMFSSPASKKTPKSKPTPSQKAEQQKKPATPSDSAKNDKETKASLKAKCNTSPVLNLGTLFSVKPVKRSSPVTVGKDLVQSIATSTTPKQPAGHPVLACMLTSPELMKGSVKNEPEAMEVIDLEADTKVPAVKEADTKMGKVIGCGQVEGKDEKPAPAPKQETAEAEKMDVDEVIVLD